MHCEAEERANAAGMIVQEVGGALRHSHDAPVLRVCRQGDLLRCLGVARSKVRCHKYHVDGSMFGGIEDRNGPDDARRVGAGSLEQHLYVRQILLGKMRLDRGGHSLDDRFGRERTARPSATIASRPGTR